MCLYASSSQTLSLLEGMFPEDRMIHGKNIARNIAGFMALIHAEPSILGEKLLDHPGSVVIGGALDYLNEEGCRSLEGCGSTVNL